MFTGIIEALGAVKAIETDGSNRHIEIESPISHELKVDQSVSHNGVCLTVVKVAENRHTVTAIKETQDKTNLGELRPGDFINLERCMINNGRFDGHIVQGHVDLTGTIKNIIKEEGSWVFNIEHQVSDLHFTIEKGSITVNGISLTCYNAKDNGFSVAIIPYTYEHTNIKDIKIGSIINLEFDIIGKYVQRLMARKNA